MGIRGKGREKSLPPRANVGGKMDVRLTTYCYQFPCQLQGAFCEQAVKFKYADAKRPLGNNA